MRNLLLGLLLSLASGAQAAFEIEVNGQELNLEKPHYINQSLIRAQLASTQDVKFGENTMRSVPKGTTINTFQNKKGDLSIHFMAIPADLPIQKWKIFGGLEVSLNCSPEGNRFRLISFHENHQIETRCSLVNEQKIPAGEKDDVTVLAGSYISFLESGRLKHASSSKGSVVIQGQSLILKEAEDIAYFENESIQFFDLKKGETFTLDSIDLKEAIFGQSLSGVQVATVFHKNGSLDQAYLFSDLPNPQKVKVLSEELELKLSEGPIGFSEEGFLNKVILRTEINIVIKKETSIYLEDRQNQESFSITLKPGDPFSIVSGTPLSFEKNRGELLLKSFPVQIKGQVYILTILTP